MESPEPAILKNHEGGHTVTIDCVPYVIGRCRTANFIVAHVNVSRNHCTIVFENNVWRIEDHSSSGTFVNGTLIGRGKHKVLNPGDVIRFGPVESKLLWTFYTVNHKNLFNSLTNIEQESQMLLNLCNEKNFLEEKISANQILCLKMRNEEKKIQEDYEQFLKSLDSNEEILKLKKNKEKLYEEINKQLVKYKKKFSETQFKEIENFHDGVLNKVQSFKYCDNTVVSEVSDVEGENSYAKEISIEKKELENMLVKQEEEKNLLLEKINEMKVAQKLLSEKLKETNEMYLLEKEQLEKQLLEKEEVVKAQVQEHFNSLTKAKEQIEADLKTKLQNNESNKSQDLLKELEEVKSALNDLESKNNALEMKLAEATNSKSEALKSKTNLIENVTDVLESELQCTICSELFVTAITLSCTHTFCKFCINQWKKKQKTCPVCRKKITSETRSLVVDNYIDKMVENLSADLKKRRDDIVAERSEVVPVKKLKKQKKN